VENRRNVRRVLKGVVVSNKMDKTVVVKVFSKKRDKRYEKLKETFKKYYAHSEKEIKIGEKVTIMECRPLSKTKKYRVLR
jgi:small subunit ribosomal protein S17